MQIRVLADISAVYGDARRGLAQGRGVRHTGIGTRGHGQEIRIIASTQWKRFHAARIHHGAQRRTGGLNIFDFAFHGNRLGLCSDFQVAVQHFRLRHRNGHGGNLDGLEAAGFDSHAIISGRKQGKPINTVRAGHGCSRLSRIDTRERYRGIWNHGARRILHRAGQSSRAGRLGA